MDQKAIYALTYGLFVLTASEDGKDSGCIINTAGQVTSTPNRVSIAVNKQNYTHDMILRTHKFTLSVLSEKAEFALFQRFGFQSGRNVDKFDGFDAWERDLNGVPYLTSGTNAFISAWVEQTVDLGTHTLFIAQVTNMETLNRTPSCTYAYYQQHIKPRPAAPKVTEGKTVWVCSVCGYVYEGEELPADFTCPICKHPASDFVKQQR